jgi:hypothetical protein
MVAASNPDLAPWILPVRILYIGFAMMTWMAYPFFNLLLRVNRFGRLVLSREQTIASNWFGGCLAGALAGVAGCVFYGIDSPWFIAAVLFGFLLLPVSAVYQCEAGRPRLIMASLAICLALLGLISLAGFTAALFQPKEVAKATAGTADLLFLCFIIGTVASTWISNILRSQKPQRR